MLNPKKKNIIKSVEDKKLILSNALDSYLEYRKNTSEEIKKIKEELEEDGKVGRPKDSVRYGKDDHPMGRDPLGIKTLKRKEGYSTYNKHKKNYQEIFKDMDGNKKKILTENNDNL